MNTNSHVIFKINSNRESAGTARILVGADFVPTSSNKEKFESGDLEGLMGQPLLNKILEADVRIFNLEVPITNTTEKLPKAGSPNLKTYEESINIFSRLKPLILSGANNHIFDYGENGIKDTKKLLSNNDINSVGFGLSYEEARKPFYYTVNGITIGIYACAENEFCCATNKRGGSNGYDPLSSFDDVKENRTHCDYLIVLFHGGRENYRYPSPQLKKICNKFVDYGADLVICQHSHCIGCYENYKKGCIIYGQGNFLFDYNDLETWQTSLLVEIVLDKSEDEVGVYPIKKEKDGIVLITDGRNRKEIMDGFCERSAQIKESGFIESEYIAFSRTQSSILLLQGIGGVKNKLILGLNRILKNKILRILFRPERNRLLLNYLRCESIRESILLLLKDD